MASTTPRACAGANTCPASEDTDYTGAGPAANRPCLRAAVEQSSFEDYPILALREAPEIEVHLVGSRRAPGGVGEPGVPPAVANALFAATGKRLRRLPLSPASRLPPAA